MLRAPSPPRFPLLAEPILAETRPRLVHCRHWVLDDAWRIADRVVPQPILWYVVAGSAHVKVNGRDHHAGAGSVLLFPPGAVLAAQPGAKGSPTLYSVNFHAWVLGDQELVVLANLPVAPPLADAERLLPLVRRLHDGPKTHPLTHPLVASACLSEMLALLLDASPRPDGPSPANRHVWAAISYIQAHLSEPLSVAAVAHAIGVSPSHLRNLFNEHLGLSPVSYLHWARFVKACNLLADPQNRVLDVALSLGFKDPNYFSRWFAGRAGLAPSIYRQRFVL